MKHTHNIKNYHGTLEQLAEVGDLYYDSLADFLHLLSEKLHRDGNADLARQRFKLGRHLKECSLHLERASREIQQAWSICEPHVPKANKRLPQTPCNLEQLQQQMAEGKAFQYLYFWGHTPKQADVVDKSCFSQWFDAPFMLEGIRYATAEHYMMVEKARLFGDEASRIRIVHSHTPAEAKTLGRQIRGFDEATWLQHRFAIVVRGNVAKFSQHPALAAYLLGTGQRVIVEASPYDAIWGIGLTADHAAADDPLQWRGLNLLGFALMVVREQLHASTANSFTVA